MKVRRRPTYTVTYEEAEGICVYDWAQVLVTASDARACMADQVELLDGAHCAVLVRMAGMRGMEREARLAFAREAPKGSTTRVAMVATSPVQRVIANFFLGLTQAVPVPTRMFTDEAQARAWLRAGAAH